MATLQYSTGPPSYTELDSKQGVLQQQQPAGAQVYYTTQPQGMSGPVNQVPYYVPPTQQGGMVVRRPDYPGPSDFLVLGLVTMIVCGILNLTSLMIGIPAVVFGAMSNHQRSANSNYKAAKRYSNLAIGLIIATIIYTLMSAFIFTAIFFGLVPYGITGRICGSYYYYGSYSYNC